MFRGSNMNRGLQSFCRRLRLICLRITKCCCRANFASGGLSSMLSTKETPKKLAAVLEQKNSPWSGDCCRLCECLFKVQKVTNFSTYPRRTYFYFPRRKVLRNGLWKSFYQKIWDFTFLNYSSRVCAKCALKIQNTIELVCFLKEK